MTEFGQLTPEEIDAVIREQIVGRIGCHANERPYIVPVTYAYDGSSIYGYTSDGLKLQIMRANPLVCFQVDDVEDVLQWRSVIAYGHFEQLTGKNAQLALELLSARLRVAAADVRDPEAPPQTFVTCRGRYGIAYRITLSERTGRFERHRH